jgi:hypothetical protein
MKLPGRILAMLITALLIAMQPCRADLFSAATYLNCLVNFQQYGDSIWHPATYANAPADSGYFGDGTSAGNGGIRGMCGVAVAYAVMAVALTNDPARPARIDKIRQTLNYAANTHLSGSNVCKDGLQWGHDWQTAEWGASMGLACALVQNDLPPATVQAVQRAVADEATYRASVAPRSGYVGDTAAEENAWDSNILALAAAWLSGNTNSTNWLTAAKKYLVNTYTVANTNGDPLASWVTTVNLYPDFELQNHGFYYPVYQMVAGMSLGESWLMARLTNPNVAAELQPFAEHNVLRVWQPLSLVNLDSGDFVYPAGLDWTLHDYEQNSYMAWLTCHFNDPQARWTDTQLAKSVAYRQQLNGNGTFIGPSETDSPFYREAVEAKRTAMCYLLHTHAEYPTGTLTAPPAYAPQLFADVGLLEQRGPAGYCSFNYYGNQVMAVIAPPAISIPTNMYLVTPKNPGVIGLGALGNPTAATLVNFATNADGFDAEFQVVNGSQGTTEVYVKSADGAVALVEVPHPAVGAVTIANGSFTVGIENQPLTGGTRLLEWTDGNFTATNRSGALKRVTNQWLCVAGEYGMIAGPAGYFSYQTASSYNILGAAQDTLQFYPSQPLGARYCVWLPGQNAATTAANATNVSWQVSGTNGTLNFTGTNGVTNSISVIVQPITTNAYLPYTLPMASITASSAQASYPPTLAADGNLATFWVSSGTAAGQGPTAAHPEWLLATFSREVALSEFRAAPRPLNGGYGPKVIQLLVNGVSVYTNTMSATANLDAFFSPPIYATNAELLITSSYDPMYPTNSRNVQVEEISFLERGAPGTFADWAMHTFTPAQLSDATLSGPAADPDGDGVPNLVEFGTGGNPLVADAAQSQAQVVPSAAGTFALQYNERTDLGDVQRIFEASTNLTDWSAVTPLQLTTVGNLASNYVRLATFAVGNAMSFYRVRFTVGQ